MSYILDALKKSEQERGKGRIPDVQTIHSSSLSYRNEKKAYWPYVLIAAIMLNLLAISYFIVKKDEPAETLAEKQTETNSLADTEHTLPEISFTAEEPALTPSSHAASNDVDKLETAESIPDTDAAAEKITRPANSPVTKSAAKEIAVQDNPVQANTVAENAGTNASTGSGSTIVEFYDLPESIQQQLPAIIISAHVYSSNPAQRSIVINNNFMEEGEYVLDGLILNEITPDGAIFNYQGTLFNYGVVSGWQ
jgi:general secretion pathway protein B